MRPVRPEPVQPVWPSIGFARFLLIAMPMMLPSVAIAHLYLHPRCFA